jgi:xanthine/uracil permease
MKIEYYENPTKISFIKVIFHLLQAEKARVIETLLFVAGINTLVQTLFGSRLPAVIGGSYTYVPTTISIILAGRFSGEPDPIEVLLLNDALLICLLYYLLCNQMTLNLNRDYDLHSYCIPNFYCVKCLNKILALI